jgi:flagellar motor switch/type III secretory pathway protein FliN
LPEGIVVVELAVLLGEDTFVARVWVPREVLVVAPQGACWSGASLANLGSMRLGLTIVASTCMVPVMDIAALGVGDVWRVGCVGSWRLGGPVLSGPVVLAAVGAEQGVAGELRLDGGVVMTGDMEGLARSDQMKDTTAVVEAVGDAPVLVRVELGTVELRAREWASLGPGDVVSLGCPLGTAVVLRAGSVEIGRGELVDLEGEVGVRLLVRFDRPPYPAA